MSLEKKGLDNGNVNVRNTVSLNYPAGKLAPGCSVFVKKIKEKNYRLSLQESTNTTLKNAASPSSI